MMSVIAFDGPEKAGKTTIINELLTAFSKVGISAERYHWNKSNTIPDDRAHTPLLISHTKDTNKVWLWDRSWPSEYVYGRLLHRNHRMTNDPWLGEWLHGRAVQTVGQRIIIAGPHPTILKTRRDESDFDIDPALEQALFVEYGERFGWDIFYSADRSTSTFRNFISMLVLRQQVLNSVKFVDPSSWCGNIFADVVFVTDCTDNNLVSGGWLPFTSESSILIGRELGDDAFKAAWVDSNTCNPELLRNKKTVITCGSIAHQWFSKIRKEKLIDCKLLVNIPDPSYFYRTQKQKQMAHMLLQSLRPL